jgi:hypothetical protein
MTDTELAVVLYIGFGLAILCLVGVWRWIESGGVMLDHEHIDED